MGYAKTFGLTEAQKQMVQDYKASCDEIVAKAQGRDVPYHGAIGGELTFSFTPTGLGDIIKVQYAGDFEPLDVTGYDLW